MVKVVERDAVPLPKYSPDKLNSIGKDSICVRVYYLLYGTKQHNTVQYNTIQYGIGNKQSFRSRTPTIACLCLIVTLFAHLNDYGRIDKVDKDGLDSTTKHVTGTWGVTGVQFAEVS